ncbi:MAG: methyltransferase domain-containing protein [Dehalococcoidales bacterium]|nr:methyltransferase domain-containing protein [Dehalococcoidales bacterium]
MIWIQHILRSTGGFISRCCESLGNYLFYLPFGGYHRFYRTCAGFGYTGQQARTLELCCGPGDLTQALCKMHGDVTGIDIDPSDIKKAASRLKNQPAGFVRADAGCLPFPAETFTDCFISLGLHHMTPRVRNRTLKEVNRVLTPDSRLIVIEYNLPESSTMRFLALALAKSDKSPEAYKMLKDRSLCNEIRDAGFDLVQGREMGWGIFQLLELKKSS